MMNAAFQATLPNQFGVCRQATPLKLGYYIVAFSDTRSPLKDGKWLDYQLLQEGTCIIRWYVQVTQQSCSPWRVLCMATIIINYGFLTGFLALKLLSLLD